MDKEELRKRFEEVFTEEEWEKLEKEIEEMKKYWWIEYEDDDETF